LGKHREKIDIVARILMAAANNAGKTQIMYEANLNYDMLKKYLVEIIGYQLLYFDDSAHYQVTDRGHEFLEAYKKYSKVNKYKERQLRLAKTKKEKVKKLLFGTDSNLESDPT
jgi:predicted transcriptional regulator